jgi:hypothetical protein
MPRFNHSPHTQRRALCGIPIEHAEIDRALDRRDGLWIAALLNLDEAKPQMPLGAPHVRQVLIDEQVRRHSSPCASAPEE